MKVGEQVFHHSLRVLRLGRLSKDKCTTNETILTNNTTIKLDLGLFISKFYSLLYQWAINVLANSYTGKK